MEAASEAATAAGASRVVPLTVAGAFHTPLMESAAGGLRGVLASTSFVAPGTPVVSNVTAKLLTTAEELPGELTDQVTNPVRWLDSVRTMLDAGIDTVLEFGPGRVLTGLVRRTEQAVEVRNVETAGDARGEDAAK